jgi:hypothetical protein
MLPATGMMRVAPIEWVPVRVGTAYGTQDGKYVGIGANEHRF